MNELDPNLRLLFLSDEPALENNGFSHQTVARIKKYQYQRRILNIVLILSAAIVAIFLSVYFGFAELMTYLLTSPIFRFEENWLTWVLSPINNIGAMLILLLNIFRIARGGRSEWRVSLLPF